MVPMQGTETVSTSPFPRPSQSVRRRGRRTPGPRPETFDASASSTWLITRDGATDGIIADRVGTGVAGYVDGNTGAAQFNQPLGLAYDSLHEELYIADSNNLRVRRYSAVSQNTTTIAGNGTGKLGNGSYVTPTNAANDALTTALNFPIGVAFLPTGSDTQGSAYVSAVYENQIRRLTITEP